MKLSGSYQSGAVERIFWGLAVTLFGAADVAKCEKFCHRIESRGFLDWRAPSSVAVREMCYIVVTKFAVEL